MDAVLLAVNGTLMRGLELNDNLLRANATFVQETQTAPIYRLWSIDDRYPAMQRVGEGGRAITVEIWSVPPAGVCAILQQEPPGLCIGKVTLADGEVVLGVLGEAIACQNRQDITEWGGWRAYRYPVA
jgi:gamma-glutamylcyclotransferase (GGCT)/AIG2-like uncharacterized protein YtfP